ncbi:MAG TPA: dTDP-4-dehydrorhamnose 3,5-epimerase [Acidobacteriaceae bacterium]|jgi:dTDP-4-dehydrorhamnose 3,5-epimerase
MQIHETNLAEVKLLEPRVFADSRGFFLESYNQRTFAELGIHDRFVQDNHSQSERGVLRGLHYQLVQPQGKLVRAVRGEIFDVAVDLRRGSPAFGQWTGHVLNEENKQMLWIPAGFGHGFLVLSAIAEVLYKATDFYAPQGERSILWNDPQIGIQWPYTEMPTLSVKDAAGKPLREAEVFH